MSGSGFLAIGGQSLAQLTAFLEPRVGRTIQDKTGLSGRFDFELKWSAGLGSDGIQSAAPPQPSNTDDAVSLSSALQEQLGLKLESRRGPGEVIVVDRVEHPTRN